MEHDAFVVMEVEKELEVTEVEKEMEAEETQVVQ